MSLLTYRKVKNSQLPYNSLKIKNQFYLELFIFLLNYQLFFIAILNYFVFNYEGKTYRFRISNVGNLWSINFRIQNHKMLLVETEGSYTNQITLDSLDVHVGQSYSVLVTADQEAKDYYIVATPKWVNLTKPNAIAAVGVLHYDNSTTTANGPLPNGPDPFDIGFSINQTRSIT